MPQRIEINQGDGTMTSLQSSWTPTPGRELEDFLITTNRPPEVQERIRAESIGILGGCISPTTGGRNVGLVLGRVQSGKTSSFTAVSALAHDNAYKLIIIIAGTTHLLVEQTTDRLIADLRLSEPNAFLRWTVCPISDKDAAKSQAAAMNLKARLNAVASVEPPLFQGIPIVVVMKNKAHLDKLNDLLDQVKLLGDVDFDKLPTLIVDDEAHMHTPDVGNDLTPSAVYQCLRDLSEKFSRRSLLQYTATPQANLLMEIADELSPDFVRVLEPGQGYIGGNEIFGSLPNNSVRNILVGEVPSNPLNTDPCPPSLKSAAANFLIVCAADFLLNGRADSRSMLIHSDVKIGVHDVYEHWVTTICDSWRMLLADPSWQIPQVFRDEFEDLKKSRHDFESGQVGLEDLRPVLRQVLIALRIQTVNHKRDVGKVDFNIAPYWIINGGNILGVGYTVVGLVTTHMIRKPGAGMADTIQQRGRFFGYLNDRFNSVRVFISPVMAKRFQDYSVHEETLRNSLKAYDSSSPQYDLVKKPTLKDWKRLFWLDPAMIPCRKKAQRLMLERVRIDKDGWVVQNRPSYSDEAISENQVHASDFITMVNSDPALGWHLSNQWGGEPGSPSTTHLEALVPLSTMFDFLSNLSMSAEDRGHFSAAILAISENNPDPENTQCLVVRIAQGADDKTFRRTRTIPISLFQGPRDREDGYVGDKKVKHASLVTVQIHVLNLVDHLGEGQKIINKDVVTVGINLPNSELNWAKKILRQP